MSGVVGFGLLGCGRAAVTGLLEPAREVRDVEVRALASRDPERARPLARRYGVPRVHESYEALLSDPAVDAVYVALPNALHAEWTTRAVAAGKHVLCEKPLAANAGEARAVADAVGAGCVVVEAFHHRHHPLASRMREIVLDGCLGRLERAEVEISVPFPADDVRYCFDLAGGATMDLGCYAIHTLRFLAGEEPEVEEAQAELWSPQVDRRMRALLCFPGGCQARFEVSVAPDAPLRGTLSLHGSRGSLHVLNPFVPHLFHRLELRGAGGCRSEQLAAETSYQGQLRAFASVLRGEAPPVASVQDALANLRVIDAVYRAAGLRPRGEGSRPE